MIRLALEFLGAMYAVQLAWIAIMCAAEMLFPRHMEIDDED